MPLIRAIFPVSNFSNWTIVNDLFIEFEWNSNYLLELVFNDFSLSVSCSSSSVESLFPVIHAQTKKCHTWNAHRKKNGSKRPKHGTHQYTNATKVNRRREQNYLCKIVLWIHIFHVIPNRSTLALFTTSLSLLMQADKKINGHLTHFIVQCSTCRCVHYFVIIDHYYFYLLYYTMYGWNFGPKNSISTMEMSWKHVTNVFVYPYVLIVHTTHVCTHWAALDLLVWEIDVLDNTRRQ